MLYYDNAATTFPKPRSVLNSVATAVTDFGGNPGRGGHNMAMKVSEKIYSIRKKTGDFFHTDAENVVFTSNCTMALNMAIKGVLQRGDHVILSCLEHNAVIRPIYKMNQDGMIDYDIAPVTDYDDEKTVSSFEGLIRPNTKAIVCTHASNVSGVVMPIRKIGAMCHRHGLIFIVDAAQSAGVLPIDMEQDNIDILCMPGHKGLYGITGSGMMLHNGGRMLNTLMEGGTGSLSSHLEQPDFSPDRYESGTVNTAGILSIEAGIDFIRSMGMDKIYRHEFTLCSKVWRAFRSNPDICLYNEKYPYRQNAPILSFNIRGMSSETITEELNRRNFALRGGLHCAPLAHEHYGTLDTGMARFAPSIFSKESEVEQFIRSVENVCKKLPS